MRSDLSIPQARRIALAAQGFADPAPTGPATRAHFKRVLARTRLLQMDSVNVLARAHYLPAFSRLGDYDEGLLDAAAWRNTARAPRLLAEYWAHEAALVPVDDWPLFGWRMKEFAAGRYRYTREVMRRNGALADDVRAVIGETGASTPKSIEDRLGIARPTGTAGGWWNLSEVKHVCEALFASGELSAVRNDHFVRHYDLAERVVGGARVAAEVDVTDAHRRLVARAAAAHGVATVADLADYYRLKTAEVKAVLPDLLDAGEVTPVRVHGWRDAAYLHASARLPRTVGRSTLLSPFDPLVFFRPRTERLFDFHYRIEIYVPEHKRTHGYYVLPYLMDGDLVGRVDVKADRRAGVLRVLSAHVEDGRDAGAVAASLSADLAALARWRGLDDIAVSRRGALGPALDTAVKTMG